MARGGPPLTRPFEILPIRSHALPSRGQQHFGARSASPSAAVDPSPDPREAIPRDSIGRGTGVARVGVVPPRGYHRLRDLRERRQLQVGIPQNYVQAHMWINLGASRFDAVHSAGERDEAIKWTYVGCLAIGAWLDAGRGRRGTTTLDATELLVITAAPRSPRRQNRRKLHNAHAN
jgi:hypothetical protein